MDQMLTIKKENTLFWYYADQKTNVVNEIKCYDCFFNAMIVFKERFLNLIDDIDILEKTFLDLCFNIGEDLMFLLFLVLNALQRVKKLFKIWILNLLLMIRKCLLIVWLI